MKYPLSTANGDAGEFFAAYKIAKELGWPCRLYDIDIGIDGQVEILTEARESTGRFVAIQVKATSAKEVRCRYVSPPQMEYWRDLHIPVFVVLVDLEKERMFLHLIEATREYELTEEGRYKVPFDLKADLFSRNSAVIMAEASERLAMSHIRAYLDPVDAAVNGILKSVQQCEDGNPDPHDLIDHMQRRTELLGLLDQADAVSALNRIGKDAITRSRDNLSWALYDLQETMTPMRYDYAHEGDISGFLSERYAFRPEDD